MKTKYSKILVNALFSLIVVSSWAATTPSPSYVEARARIMLGQLEQAVELAKSNDLDISSEQSVMLLAEVYAQIGQDEKAIEILNSVEPVEMPSEFKEKKLEIYAQNGNILELQKLLPISLNADQEGLKYYALASMRKAGSSKYLKALKLKAASYSDRSAVGDLAWVYYQIGAFAEAIKLLKSETSPLDDSVAKDQALLALSYVRIRQTHQACSILEKNSDLQSKSSMESLVINKIAEILACFPKSLESIDSSKSNASEALTMKPEGAFRSDKTRVSYVDRLNGHFTKNLPIPEGVWITGASGVLLGQGQYVLTNRHVVEEGSHFAVKNALGHMSKARVIKVSAQDDFALLELEQPFPSDQAVTFSEIASAKPGGQIYSMGFPLWYVLGTKTPSITNGLVSKNSGMNDDPKMFQITAKINKGNSGGPVFDRYGNLVGLTTAKLDTESLRQSEGVSPEGVNFIYQSKEIIDFAGQYLGSGRSHVSTHNSLSPEEVYEKRLGSTVMVAVGK